MEQNEGRDLVLPNNAYAYVLDQTKGNIICYVGPSKTQLADTDKTVVFDYNEKKYRTAHQTEAIQNIKVAPEGWYMILKNPSKTNDQPKQGQSESISIDKLDVGRKVHIPGPMSFPLWPGQMAEVVQGHRLRSNQYLIIRVYDAEAARENWKSTIIQKTAQETPAPAPLKDTGKGDEKSAKSKDAPDEITDAVEEKDSVSADVLHDDIDFAVGKLMIVKGTDVSFFIPPTGIEVVKDDQGDYIREAVTLERLTYCILLDENGSKRYVRGPAVVFPKPTEIFQTREKEGYLTRKFRAIELNHISGLYIKVIADYKEGGKEFKEGDELFITGKEQAIYYRRDEHQVIRYGNTEIHFATAIPKGEGLYVMDRLNGKIATIKGPEMYLPDPRTKVIIRRILPPEMVTLMFPSNDEAVVYNHKLRDMTDTDFVVDSDFVGSNVDDETMYTSNIGASAGIAKGIMRSAKLSADSPYASHEGRLKKKFRDDTGVLEKSSTYTKPRTVTLDTKYQGAVKIQIWTGYAVMIVNGVGERKVIEGPATYNLEYDEYPEVISMSTGKPKTTDHLKKDIYLRTKNNKVADIFTIETKDFVNVTMKLSFKVNFVGEKENWFDVENYVKYLCDHMRSRLKGFGQTISLNDFYGDSVNHIRNVVLGMMPEISEGATTPSRGFLFDENHMFVADVEVLKVVIDDHGIANDIINTQKKIVAVNIKKSRKETLLALKKELVAIEEEESELEKKQIEVEASVSEFQIETDMELDTKQKEAKKKRMETSHALITLDQEQDHSLESDRIEFKITQRDKEDESIVERQTVLDAVAEAELNRTKKIDMHTDAMCDLKTDRQKTLITIQSDAVVKQMGAVQPGLVEALNANSQVSIAKDIIPGVVPLSIVEGRSVGHTLTNLFQGTELGNAFMKLSQGMDKATKEIEQEPHQDA